MSLSLKVTSESCLVCGEQEFRCAVGKSGFIAEAEKREGDHKTPIGSYPMKELWYRADKVMLPQTLLPSRMITRLDGWCDDPLRPEYNQPVMLPFEGSHERMWREDDAYDIVIVLGHNDSPPVAGMGSAIFFHLAQLDFRGTEGCVAIAKEEMLALLPQLSTDSWLHISPE